MVAYEPIKLIVGLGNPGAEYAATRHNAGVWFVKKVAARYDGVLHAESKFHGLSGAINIAHNNCQLLIPSTYMNCSGRAVQAVANFYKISPAAILIVHDELDFPPGVARFKFGGGANGHNGLKDIIMAIDSSDFHRLRIGIGKPPTKVEDMADYVLSRPSHSELTAIEEALDKAVDLVPGLMQGVFNF